MQCGDEMRTDAEDPLTLRRDALRRAVYGTPDPSAAVIAELVQVEAEFAARDAVVSSEASRGQEPTPGSGSHTDRVVRSLHALSARGVRIAMDAFGTG